MVATPSTMIQLGTIAPDFALPDFGVGASAASDPELSTSLDVAAADASAVVVMFLSNHCPYVQHIGRELGLISQRLSARGAAFIGIMSNDVIAYPDDAPSAMTSTARSYGWDFPYLFDESQEVARDYRAACTPDFFVFDAGRALRYRGQFDSSRPSNDVPVTGSDLVAAVNAVLRGESPTDDQFPSLGCNIKWRQ